MRGAQAIAIIPARGGSKGLARKNVLPLAGQPLIAHSIRVALATPDFDAVVVSTDDQEIADVARRCGAQVPFLRPEALARDDSPVGLAVDFTLRGLGIGPDDPALVATLYPTHPLRSVRLMELLLGKLRQGHTHVTTVAPVRYGPLFARGPESGPERTWTRAFPGADATHVREYGVFIGRRQGEERPNPYYHILDNPLMRLDIDDASDMALAGAVLERGLFDFEEAL